MSTEDWLDVSLEGSVGAGVGLNLGRETNHRLMHMSVESPRFVTRAPTKRRRESGPPDHSRHPYRQRVGRRNSVQLGDTDEHEGVPDHSVHSYVRVVNGLS